MDKQNPITEIQEWTVTLTESVSRVAVRVLEYLPTVLGAMVLLLVGWGVAWLLSYTTAKITEKTLARLALTRPMDTRVRQPQYYSAAPAIASRVIFWVVLLFFILAAAELLQLQVVSGLLSAVTGYLPSLLAGLLILFIGLWLAEATRAVLKRSGARFGIQQADSLARLGQLLVLFIVFAVAAGQVGIDNTLLVVLVAILFGIAFGAVALAFSLGARATVANLLAAQSVAQIYNPGDTIRVGDIQGKLLRITRTSVVLETADGQTLVPAKRFNEQESVLVTGAGTP